MLKIKKRNVFLSYLRIVIFSLSPYDVELQYLLSVVVDRNY